MKTIFLDFDGVLHGTQYYSDFFSHMDKFCECVMPYAPNFHIVISSSWKEEHKLDMLQEFFSPEIQSLVVGVTPVLIDGFSPEGRYKEIMSYCLEHNIQEWVAVDDLQKLFPIDCANLILVNGISGLTIENFTAIENFLRINGS